MPPRDASPRITPPLTGRGLDVSHPACIFYPMRDTLEAFANHCTRIGLLHRPTMFARFIDIWGDERGEIGLPDPEDIYHSTFALLTPWIMVPTIAEVHFVHDRVERLEVTSLRASNRGYFDPSWQVDYRMDDRGELVFGEAIDAPCLPEVGTAIIAAKKARMEQRFWQWSYTFDDVVAVVDGLLSR